VLATRLRDALAEKGRLEWHAEYCARLIADNTLHVEPDADRVWRVKGYHELERPALAVLRQLWRWREAEAVRANRPPFFILSPDLLCRIAAASSVGEPWEQHIPRRMHPNRVFGLRYHVQIGLKVPPEQHPDFLRQNARRLTNGEIRLYNEIEKRRNEAAHSLGMDPSFIAGKVTLVGLAREGGTERADLMRWQERILFGE
jgi:ribonuclease D